MCDLSGKLRKAFLHVGLLKILHPLVCLLHVYPGLGLGFTDAL